MRRRLKSGETAIFVICASSKICQQPQYPVSVPFSSKAQKYFARSLFNSLKKDSLDQ